jgi:hypothetical protein
MAVESKKLQESVQSLRALRVRTRMHEEDKTLVTRVRLSAEVQVAVIDGCISLWTAGREVRIGPLTTEQAQQLCEDLGYEAVS